MKKSLGPKTLALPTPVWVICTYDQADQPNLMTAAWCGICSSKPPCLTVSLQKGRHSLHGLVERKSFTACIPSESYLKQADYVGIVSGRKENKFATTGLTPVRSELVDAPYVGEFPLVLECRVIHTLEVGMHTMYVGEILDVKAEEEALSDKGLPDMLKVRPILFDPGHRGYYGVGNYLARAFSATADSKKL